MSDTPRTDTQEMDALDCDDVRAWADFARQLERELAAANRIIDLNAEFIQALEIICKAAKKEVIALWEKAERWKERAEYEYAQRRYPDTPGLAVGALDVAMKTWRWERKQECVDAVVDAARKLLRGLQ